MRTIGNVLWFVLAGWWLALAYAVAGLLACVLIVTIPFGIASFRLAGYALWPFGRRVVVRRGAGIPSLLGNIIWILLFGWQQAVLHVLAGQLLMLTPTTSGTRRSTGPSPPTGSCGVRRTPSRIAAPSRPPGDDDPRRTTWDASRRCRRRKPA
jgi:hypothetical protein